mgnify:CR=1 FL=1
MKFIYNAFMSLLRKSPLLPSLKTEEVGRLKLSNNPKTAIDSVLSATGEVSSLVYAEHFLSIYENMTEKQKIVIFKYLLENLDIDHTGLTQAAEEYGKDPTQSGMTAIKKLSEPEWQIVFERLNATANGTVKLVRLREDLLKYRREHPELLRMDVSLLSLFKTLFNPGYLVMEPIDWTTPATVLEKIIAYEAVHEISSWDELRARLAPSDRRCFAFFHLAMPDEPLIFVEVALTDKIPDSIQSVLVENRNYLTEDATNTAVFYSISNCQNGLVGVSFGNLLLKQVVQQLQEEIPSLKTFVTLSPVPGFTRWLSKSEPELYKTVIETNWINSARKHRKNLESAMARYILISDRQDKAANDPVARFHLGNGATVHRFNYLGDISENGLKQSAGMMINYMYELNTIDINHENYSNTKKIMADESISGMVSQ